MILSIRMNSAMARVQAAIVLSEKSWRNGKPKRNAGGSNMSSIALSFSHFRTRSPGNCSNQFERFVRYCDRADWMPEPLSHGDNSNVMSDPAFGYPPARSLVSSYRASYRPVGIG